MSHNSAVSLTSRAREYLGLNRNIGVLALSTFGLALGEELWLAFLPAYLVALGASGLFVGAFSSLKDLLDGLYQYPGGWLSDRIGLKRSLMVFTGVALAGYGLAAAAPGWEVLFAALVLIMAWKSGAFPASFAIIGDALPKGKRGIAFSVISMLQRVPRVLGAPLGGLLITTYGVVAGMRSALVVTIFLACGVLLFQKLLYRADAVRERHDSSDGFVQVLKSMSPTLKRLLGVECIIRTAEAIAASFIVLYVIEVQGYSAGTFGLLFALQQATAIALYIPSGRIADVTGRRPIIAFTFFCFAAFPLAVVLAGSPALLVSAFVIGGLKEFGEPARKSLIVDLVDPGQRGRMVGVYYTVRNLSIVPAGILGGVLWQMSPAYPLLSACGVGFAGIFLFLYLSREGFT
ncbi:MAG: MFS transporter [Bacteroidota bacterium]